MEKVFLQLLSVKRGWVGGGGGRRPGLGVGWGVEAVQPVLLSELPLRLLSLLTRCPSDRDEAAWRALS